MNVSEKAFLIQYKQRHVKISFLQQIVRSLERERERDSRVEGIDYEAV